MFEPAPIETDDGVTAEGSAVITAAVPAAADAGLAILRKGGNVFDAAVAACLVETVALPMKCGLAGDVVALVRENGRRARALISVGGGAAALADGAEYLETGPRSVGIPGAPDGYAALAKLGKLSRADLAEPAIQLAKDGCPWSQIAVALTREAEALLRKFNRSISYLPNGKLPNAGDRLMPTKLAEVLSEFARSGPALFEGAIGEALVAKTRSGGGFLTMSDMATRPACWQELESVTLSDNRHLHATPYPTHGLDLTAAAALLDREGLDAYSAFAQIFSRPAKTDAGTSVVCCADRDGNAAVVVHSNSFPQYGSGLVVEDYDLILSNRPGRGFDLDGDPSSPNAPAPGRRPKTTLHAWMLETDDADFYGATPGGHNQLPWNLQTIELLLAGERNMRELATRPRWGLTKSREYVAEQGHKLAGTGSVATVPPLTLRSVNQLVAVSCKEASVSASADPRIGSRACAM